LTDAPDKRLPLGAAGLGDLDNAEISPNRHKNQAPSSAADNARLQLLAKGYAELDADFIKVFGGDKFTPLFVIREGTHHEPA
jgi:hypothetical protein